MEPLLDIRNLRVGFDTDDGRFVAVDDIGIPVEVPPVLPETELEKERFEAALRRKQLSLVLAGKMKPHDATELKALFKD